MKRKITIFCAIAILCLGVHPVFAGAIAQKEFYPSEESREETESDKVWTEDMDKKLDKSIEVLKVIREELKDVEAENVREKKAVSSPAKGGQTSVTDENAEWGDNFRKMVTTAGRIWRKVKKVTMEELEEPRTAATSAATEERVDADISGKLNKAIEAMKVIKDEVDKMAVDDKKGSK